MLFGDAIRARAADTVANLAVKLAGVRSSTVHVLDTITGQPHYTPPAGDALSLAKLYNTNPWVRTIVSKIGRGVAKPKWYLENESGDRIDKHPALEWLRAGNKKMRGRQAIALTVTYKDLQGECFWVLGRDATKRGAVADFAPIPSNWVVTVPYDGFPFYTIQPKSGRTFDIPESQVLHFRDVDPTDPYGRGTSITGAMKVELSADEAAAQYLDSHFKNRARPDLIITGSEKQPMSAIDAKKLELTWLEKFRGAKRAGRPLFSAGPIEVKEVGANLRDNMMAPVRAELKQTISEAYSIPPEILGRLTSSNRATIESADYLLAVHTIVPRLEWLKDVLEPFMAEEFGLKGLTLQYDNPVAENVDQILKAMQAFPEDFTPNEVRTLVGRKPLPDGDERHEPKIPLMQPGEGGEGNDGPPKPPGKKPKPAEDDEDDEPDKGTSPARDVAKSMTLEDIVRVSEAHEDPMVRAEASALMDGVLRGLLMEYGGELLKQLEDSARFELNSKVANWLIGRGSRLMGEIDATTREALKASLVSGAASNEAVEQLLERVEELFKDAARKRATMISQTEATELTGFGSLAAAEQAGMERKQWLSSQDHVVRDTHRALHKQVKLLNEPFQSTSGAQAQHPGAFGVAKEDINCRCAMRPVLDGEKAFGQDEFEAWYPGARDVVTSKIEETVRNIFYAQAEVVKTQLRRALS